MALRPQGMNEPDSPFFLNVNHHPKEGNPARFISQAMGHNTMGEIMKKAGERAKLYRPVSNHAARKTTVQRLHQRRFSDSMVASFTGHKNPDSVRHYYVPSLKESHYYVPLLRAKPQGKFAPKAWATGDDRCPVAGAY